MCELFGASSSGPRDFSPWLMPFRERGGGSGDNPDGWGLATWDGKGLAIVKQPEPGCRSAEFARLAAMTRARLLIGHVRRAMHPPVPGMLNTHPFAHACCGREWAFAHNGMVPEVIAWQPAVALCHPDGETDSEHAFCRLLAAISNSYDSGEHAEWIAALAELAGKIAAVGKFNFLLSDGRLLLAYGHDRLHRLERTDADGAMALIATEPLTGDAWQPFEAGELRVYRDGVLRARLRAGGKRG